MPVHVGWYNIKAAALKAMQCMILFITGKDLSVQFNVRSELSNILRNFKAYAVWHSGTSFNGRDYWWVAEMCFNTQIENLT